MFQQSFVETNTLTKKAGKSKSNKKKKKPQQTKTKLNTVQNELHWF